VNETVAVALITAGSGVLIATMGSLTTYVVTRRQAQAEQLKTREENQRLLEQLRSEERRDRHQTYKECMLVLNRFEEMEHASNLPDEEIEAAWERYRSIRSALELYAPKPVTEALLGDGGLGAGGLHIVLAEVRRYAWGTAPKGRAERWKTEYHKRRQPFQRAQRKLIQTMHEDVTENIL
jgi:hypothetical protein